MISFVFEGRKAFSLQYSFVIFVAVLYIFLQELKQKIEKLNETIQGMQEQKVEEQNEHRPDTPPASPMSPPTQTDLGGVTVITRVEERSTFDVSRILADLDAKEAELLVLQTGVGILSHCRTFVLQGG